ncbi:MAG: hypothetical protein VX186_07580 [Nitrospinota bacterium]|nr:hypothetical protein [Nitrospinota bacterium]
MLEQNLNVLIPAEFVFLKNRKRNSAYNHEPRKKLYGIITGLERRKSCTEFFAVPTLESF